MRHILASLLFLLALDASADERILSYHSDIEVHADASMTVTETIRVRAEGDRIRQGIFREFPTRYRDQYGNNVIVEFSMVSASRNGEMENYFTEDRNNGVRIYFGTRGKFLPTGEHVYEFTYHTNRQLGYFGDRDELYWNVNGLDWDFPIDALSATVYLPEGVPAEAVQTDAYTGSYGSKDGNAFVIVNPDASVDFRSSKPMGPGQGMSIVVNWPAGFVDRPTVSEGIGWFLEDNLAVLVALLGFGLLLWYYLWIWNRVGRDPEAGPVFPHYLPPQGLSPAAMRYIVEMGLDGRGFSAAIISLAVKGQVILRELDDDYSIERVEDAVAEGLSKGERTLMQCLFSDGPVAMIEKDNYVLIGNAQRKLENALEGEYRNVLFRKNVGYLVLGMLLTAFSAIAMFTTLSLAYGAGAVAVIGLFIAMLVANVVFGFLLPAPTRAGRQVLDQVDGFRMYLSVAEKDELQLRNPPERTPALFEKYLPYALALGVEDVWGERFANVLAAASVGGNAYHPVWYSGTHWSISQPARFTTSLGESFSSAVSSAATPPGSSSGGGGGGFSGGGGGGGGGGGW